MEARFKNSNFVIANRHGFCNNLRLIQENEQICQIYWDNSLMWWLISWPRIMSFSSGGTGHWAPPRPSQWAAQTAHPHPITAHLANSLTVYWLQEHPGLRGTPLAMLAAQCNKLSSMSPPPLADAAVGKGFHPWKKSGGGSPEASGSSNRQQQPTTTTTASFSSPPHQATTPSPSYGESIYLSGSHLSFLVRTTSRDNLVWKWKCSLNTCEPWCDNKGLCHRQ